MKARKLLSYILRGLLGALFVGAFATVALRDMLAISWSGAAIMGMVVGAASSLFLSTYFYEVNRSTPGSAESELAKSSKALRERLQRRDVQALVLMMMLTIVAGAFVGSTPWMFLTGGLALVLAYLLYRKLYEK